MRAKESNIKKGNYNHTADNFLIEASRLVAAIVCGDTKKLDNLTREFMQIRTEQIDATNLPVDPWKNPAVAYGAYLALAEIAELSGRTVIPHDVLKKLLNSKEAHRILLKLSEEPGGIVEQSKIPQLTYIHRCNANDIIQKLEKLGLLTRQKVGLKSKKRTLELTNTGWSVVDLLHAWGLELPKEKPPLVNLLRAEPRIKDLAHDISERTIAYGAYPCGEELGTIIDNEKPPSRLRLCKAISHNIKEFTPKKTVEFFSGIVRGNNPKIPKQFLFKKIEEISRTKKRIKGKQTSPKKLRSDVKSLIEIEECEVFLLALQERITQDADFFKEIYR